MAQTGQSLNLGNVLDAGERHHHVRGVERPMRPIYRLLSLAISAMIVIVAIPVLFGIGIVALGFVLVTSLIAGIAARIMLRRNPDIMKNWQKERDKTGPIIEHE